MVKGMRTWLLECGAVTVESEGVAAAVTGHPAHLQ